MRKCFFTITLLTSFSFSQYAQTLYGLTSQGGVNNFGHIFSYTPSTSAFTAVHTFTSKEGFNPRAGLVQYADGNFYGMTNAGGTYGDGVIFSFSPATNIYTVRFEFRASLSGRRPEGNLVQATDGKLYGVTFAGGGDSGEGVIFSYSPTTSTYTTLYEFINGTNGRYPVGSMVMASDGKLYGTTSQGGINDRGVLFSYSPSTSTFAKLYDFATAGAGVPMGGLIQGSDGKLYGTTIQGGAWSLGVLFSFSPSSLVFTKLYNFEPSNGCQTYGSLVQASDGKLYGGTRSGGSKNHGVLFSFSPTTFAYKNLLDFDSTNGGSTSTALMQASDGKLYGMTYFGGMDNEGVIFSCAPTTSSYTKLQDFYNIKSAKPLYGPLIELNTSLLPPDNTSPGAPMGLHVVTRGGNFISLDWDNSADNIGVVAYDVYRNGVRKYTTSQSEITADGLDLNTIYTFTIKARDVAGNTSGFSNQATGTTAGTLNGLIYKYYEGTWNFVPDFSVLTPVKTGITHNVDLAERVKEDNFGFTWEGYINIPKAGDYIFEMISDDGSKLFFDEFFATSIPPLIRNDGIHADRSATGTVTTTSGFHKFAIAYFQGSGGKNIEVYWTGPGIQRQRIPDASFIANNSGSIDKIAPGIPPNPHVVSTGSNFINLAWDNSTDNEGVVAYDIYRNGVKSYTSSQPDIKADGLSPNTSYTFTIKARDAAGNTSDFSNTVSGTTTHVANANGLNYRYYEGNWDVLPNFNSLSAVQTGSSANVDINVRPVGHDDNFGFVWEGFINIPAGGSYTFETVSDDGSKLYFNTFYDPNATATVNNDGLHPAISATGTVNVPAAGLYPIGITFFEKYSGQSMSVYWSGPGIPRQLIPNSAFTSDAPPPPPASGLAYRYYEGNWNVLPDFTALSPVQTGTSPNVDISVRPSGHDDNFGFVWEGYITIPTTGTYIFETISDDGSKFYFNSFYDPNATATVNNDGLHPPVPGMGTVNNITAGSYPVAITFFEKYSGEVMQVYWTGPGIPRQLIPNSAFTQSIPTPMTTFALSSIRLRDPEPEAGKGKAEMRKLYPNPFIENFNIDFYNSAGTNDINVSIYDLKGRLVYVYHAGNLPAGNATLKVNLGGRKLPAGLYMVGINVNGALSKMLRLLKAEQ